MKDFEAKFGLQKIKKRLPRIQKRLQKDNRLVKGFLTRKFGLEPQPELSDEQNILNQAGLLQAMAANGAWDPIRPQNFDHLDPIHVVLTRTQVLKNMEDHLREQSESSVYVQARSVLDKLVAYISMERANSVKLIGVDIDEETVQRVKDEGTRQRLFSDPDKVIGMGLSDMTDEVLAIASLSDAHRLRFKLLAEGNRIRSLEAILETLDKPPVPPGSKTGMQSEAHSQLKKKIDLLKEIQARQIIVLSKLITDELQTSATISSDEQS